MKFIQLVKPKLLKVTLSLVATLLLVQYWRHISLNSQRFEPLFFINSAMNKIKYSNGGFNGTLLEGVDDFNSHNGSSTELRDAKANNETTLCPLIPPNLNGPIKIITTIGKFKDAKKVFADIETGGVFRPKECKARYVVALVIPYRDRAEHLVIFLNNIHRMLMKQQIDYRIFVIEQDGTGPFNRGKLMNVGFKEASKIRQYDCFIFHDVDLIPEDDRNLYSCPEQPRHLSVAVDKFNYRLPYPELFGGACAINTNHFEMTNGFSNLFWGWGGEDDDMYSRLRRKGLHVSRYPPTIARYTMLLHNKQPANPKRYEILQEGKKRFAEDGLRNLDYERKVFKNHKLYTWILVDLHPP